MTGLQLAPLGAGSVPNTTGARPRFRIYALGPLRVDGPRGPLSGEWLDQRAGELLRFFVCERGRIVSADVIGEAIWPHAGSAAPNTVRHFVHTLRAKLEPGRSPRSQPTSVICRGGGYGLDLGHVWVDADEFEQLVRSGLAALGHGRPAEVRAPLERAMELYRGDFLADELYGDWALVERERLRAVACEALRALAEIGADNPETRSLYLEQLAELEPFDDDVQRELLMTWLRMGRRSRAVRQYESFRARLLHRFGTLPDFELSELARALTPRRCA